MSLCEGSRQLLHTANAPHTHAVVCLWHIVSVGSKLNTREPRKDAEKENCERKDIYEAVYCWLHRSLAVLLLLAACFHFLLNCHDAPNLIYLSVCFFFLYMSSYLNHHNCEMYML